MSDLDFESKFDKYKNVNLAIEGSAIIPNDRFKEEYAKVIRNNLDEFNNILNKIKLYYYTNSIYINIFWI